MEQVDVGKQKLMSGIIENAKTEAEKILGDARRSVDEKRKAGEVQIGVLKKQTDTKIAQQLEAIAKRNKQAIAMEKRRRALREQEHLFELVLETVSKTLDSMVDAAEYRDVLKDWVVEAALGLHISKAHVNVSKREQHVIDEHFLHEAEQQLEAIAGWKTTLNKSTADPLLVQGVVLTSVDRRIAFNNQVPTRLSRIESEIKNLIYTELSADMSG